MNIEKDKYVQAQAVALLGLLQSDFGGSGTDVQLEAIKVELEAAWDEGINDHIKRLCAITMERVNKSLDEA